MTFRRRSPEELEAMIEEARVIYGGRRYTPRWAQRLLVGYALICYGVSLLYHAQDSMMGGGGRMFGEQILRGLGVAGWIIGLIAGLGGFLIVVGIIGLLLIEAAKIIWPADEKEEEVLEHDDTDH